ncbi:acid phosphatase [Cladorrhinum sp. PSN332]|nr:acid phosphatase [Cladorrhinum sp. PSN332]
MKTVGIVVLVLVLALIGVGIWWVVFTRIRASRLGLPAPSFTSYIPFLGSSSSSASYSGPTPAPGGIRGWFNDRMRNFQQSRNKRTAAGAYEGSSAYNAGYDNTNATRGGGRFDEDAAWDSRVHHDYNPYEEERELGLQPPAAGGAAGQWGGRQQQQVPQGEGYQMNLATETATTEGERGRTRSRSPGRNPFEDPVAASGRRNPFGDDSELQVGGGQGKGNGGNGVSPRPIDTGAGGSNKGQEQQKEDNSPTERKSIFRENV